MRVGGGRGRQSRGRHAFCRTGGPPHFVSRHTTGQHRHNYQERPGNRFPREHWRMAEGLFHRSLGQRPRNSNGNRTNLAEGHIHRTPRSLLEYGLRPKIEWDMLPGALPQATVKTGLRPENGDTTNNISEHTRGCETLANTSKLHPKSFTALPVVAFTQLGLIVTTAIAASPGLLSYLTVNKSRLIGMPCQEQLWRLLGSYCSGIVNSTKSPTRRAGTK